MGSYMKEFKWMFSGTRNRASSQTLDGVVPMTPLPFSKLNVASSSRMPWQFFSATFSVFIATNLEGDSDKTSARRLDTVTNPACEPRRIESGRQGPGIDPSQTSCCPRAFFGRF